MDIISNYNAVYNYSTFVKPCQEISSKKIKNIYYFGISAPSLSIIFVFCGVNLLKNVLVCGRIIYREQKRRDDHATKRSVDTLPQTFREQ